MTKRTSLVLSDEQDEVVDDLVDESHRREGLPAMSRSEVLRWALDRGLAIESSIRDRVGDEVDVEDMIPDSVLIKYRRERFLDSDADLRNLRTGFESRVADMIRRRWENGYDADALDRFAKNLKGEARILWPDDDDRAREAIEYVDAVVESAIDARESSSWDPLDPDRMFEDYGGVREGEREDRIDREALDRAIDLVERRTSGPQSLSRMSVGPVLKKESNGLDDEVVDRALAEVFDEDDDRADAPDALATDGGGSHE